MCSYRNHNVIARTPDLLADHHAAHGNHGHAHGPGDGHAHAHGGGSVAHYSSVKDL